MDIELHSTVKTEFTIYVAALTIWQITTEATYHFRKAKTLSKY